MRVVLASKSPRRREILSMLGVQFDIVSADADESSDITDPEALVTELALRKGLIINPILQHHQNQSKILEQLLLVLIQLNAFQLYL